MAQHQNYMSMRYLFHPAKKKPFSYKLFINTKEKKKSFPWRETSGLCTTDANFYLEKKVTWRMIGNGCSFLSISGQWGAATQAMWASMSLVKPTIKTTAAFSRPKSSRKNHSSKREFLLSKVIRPKLEYLHTTVNLVQCTQPHNAFPTQRTPLNNYSLCKPASFSSHST